ncbi:MAG: rhodanese-like domain-containing protein [Deltaproteobacteria bacterium]|nr:rhodanese-like domain-containing protein [Deltaproteobacteria bacterium]
MKFLGKLLIIVVFVCLMLSGAFTVFGEEMKIISPAELAQIIPNKKIVLINTMSKIECDDHSIVGSTCIPVETMEGAARKLPQDRLVVFYCESESGTRCRQAASIARAQGLQNIAILGGGSVGWRKAGFDEVSLERIRRRVIVSLGPVALRDFINKNKSNIFILDIRSEEAFHKGHIKGAENIPFYLLHERYSAIPSGKKIVVVDDKGLRSFLAASYLVDKGFRDVIRLARGMAGWNEGTN